jgi:hypothetical protein
MIPLFDITEVTEENSIEVLRTIVETVQNLTGVQFGNEEELLAQILAAIQAGNVIQGEHKAETVNVKNAIAMTNVILNSFIPLFNEMITILKTLKKENQGVG